MKTLDELEEELLHKEWRIRNWELYGMVIDEPEVGA